jgi:hypothetical protein
MIQPFRFSYKRGDPRPDPTKNSPRAILLWEKGKREYEEFEFRKQLERERYANREPETIAEFQVAESNAAARRLRQAAIEAEEDRQHTQQQKEAQERLRQQAKEKDQRYIQYWEATTAEERTAALIAYAQALGTADGYSGGFATQGAVDRTIASLRDIANCPESFKRRYREIRLATMAEPPEPESSSHQRLATAGQQLLGDGIAALEDEAG